MTNELLQKLGISTPIIQAPMASVSTPPMAAAVSNSGGLGSLGVGASPARGARQLILETRALTTKPFNVNLFCHPPAVHHLVREARWLDWLAPQFARFSTEPPLKIREIYKSFIDDESMLAMLLETRPAVVSFHFGLPPAQTIKALKDAGIVLLATATNLGEADLIAKAGIDAIVAQGIEAGGHRGNFDPQIRDDYLGTFALTRLLVAGSAVPIIASGGIMDGAGIAAALALGAQAAQLGTAFVACPESSIDAGYRLALTGGSARKTVFTTSISGRMARSLSNEFTALDQDPLKPPTPAYPIAYDAGKALHAAAVAQGHYGFGAQWAGQATPLLRALPAAELVETLKLELREAANALANQIGG